MEKRKILIADAAEEFRAAVADALHGAYYVRSASDGVQALQLLRSFLPDVRDSAARQTRSTTFDAHCVTAQGSHVS